MAAKGHISGPARGSLVSKLDVTTPVRDVDIDERRAGHDERRGFLDRLPQARPAFDALMDQLHALPDAIKGRQFERLVKWYLETAPEYRSLVKRVYLWNEWPGRWGVDAGIDLVVATKADDLWAVQAKAYGSGYSIKKADVDSFLSESNRLQFSFRLLVATTDHLGDKAARTIHEQEKPVGLKLLSQLRHENVQWPKNLERLEAPAPVRFAPLPHQVEAIEAVVNGQRDVDRGQLLMACGTGKTLAGLWIDEALSSQRTLVIVPSLSLLGQTLRAWSAQAAERFEYLAVCSDQTVASTDSFTSWTADLGVPVTTDVGEIGRFLSKDGRRVVFSTYHSTPAIASAQDAGAPRFDLAIADEAHRAAGRVDSSFSTVLDPERIRATRRIFMTATPRIVSSGVRAAAREQDIEVTSMDDVGKFGAVLHQLSFREAIDRGLLSDYRVVIIGVDDPGVGHAVRRRDLLTIGSADVDAETLARQVGLLRVVSRFRLTRILTFHSRKATARSFARGLRDVLEWLPRDLRPPGRLWADSITGDMSEGERRVLLDQLRSLEDADWGVLTNVRCVAEGVDVPALDGVVFIDPRRSHIDVVQAVGRAIRRSPEKKLGIVVIPVFVPPGVDDEEVLDSSDFQKVWAVVRALRAHDDVLAEQLDAARYQLGRRRGPTELPTKIILDLPRAVSLDFARALSARIVERSTSSFEFWFGLLARYVDEHGTAAIGSDTVLDGCRLGTWTSNMRGRYTRGEMSAEHVSRLEAMPGWVWNAREADWERTFVLLRQYINEHGTAAVTRDTVIDEVPLGRWCMHQRRRYARGELEPDRVSRLEALPGWAWNLLDATWERYHELLTKFVDRERTAMVPRDQIEEGEPLGRWVRRQRQIFNGVVAGKLTKDQIDRLVALSEWSWDLQDEKWERGFRAFLAYVARENRTYVPPRHIEAGVNLGAWVIRQQIEYKHRRLQRQGDRVARLEAVPGWKWSVSPAERWDRAHAALVKFQQRQGHVEVPANRVEDGVNVGNWVRQQRYRYSSGYLQRHPDRIARLEAIPGWRWPRIRTLQPPPSRSSRARPTLKHDRMVESLGRVGRPMSPSALWELMVTEGVEHLPASPDSLNSMLWHAAQAGRIKKVNDGLYAPAAWHAPDESEIPKRRDEDG